MKGSSSDKNKLEIGDHIFAVDGKKPSDKENIYKLMKNAGSSVTLSLFKNGELLPVWLM